MSGNTDIVKYGLVAKGKRELASHQGGKKLSYRGAVIAKCYECMNGYADGKQDCKIAGCPLYHYMPYRTATAGETTRKPVSDAEREQILAYHKQGIGNNEIARMIGCSKGAVTNVVHFGTTSGRVPIAKTL